jgi:hypothetical protein
MKISTMAVLGIIGALVIPVLVVESKAHAASAPARRKVTGKSGHTWFVQAFDGDSFGVFGSERGNDQVLAYDQKDGKRTVTFSAPTSLAAAAKSDFI